MHDLVVQRLCAVRPILHACPAWPRFRPKSVLPSGKPPRTIVFGKSVGVTPIAQLVMGVWHRRLATSLLLCLCAHRGAGQATSTATTATATSVTSTITPDPSRDGCPRLSTCLNHSGCSTCLNNISQFAPHVGSLAESGHLETQFFLALRETPECWPDVTPRHMLGSALQVSASDCAHLATMRMRNDDVDRLPGALSRDGHWCPLVYQ